MALWAGETSLGGPVSLSESVSLADDNLNPDRSYFKTNACPGHSDSPKLTTEK